MDNKSEIKLNKEYELLNKVNSENKNAYKISKLFGLIAFVIGTFALIISIFVSTREKKITQNNLQIEKQIKDSLWIINQKYKLLNYGLSEFEVSNLTKQDLEKIDVIDKEINDLSKKIDTSIIIRYYPKLTDQDRTIINLKDLGYNVQTYDPKDRNINNPTNIIWVGSNINNKINDIKFIAFYLIRGGYKLKMIKLFRFPNDFKQNLIEIGSDINLKDSSNLTLSTLINAKGFDRNGILK